MICVATEVHAGAGALSVDQGKEATESQSVMLSISGPTTNELDNGSAEEGLDLWTLKANGGDGWSTTNAGYDDNGGGFITSWADCTREQVIDLLARGYDPVLLDQQPQIIVGEYAIAGWPDFADTFHMTVELLAEDKSVLTSYVVGPVELTEAWTWYGVVFKDYGPGVRYVRFEDGGLDT